MPAATSHEYRSTDRRRDGGTPMTPTTFTLLFGACVVVSTLAWLYLVGVTIREFGASRT